MFRGIVKSKLNKFEHVQGVGGAVRSKLNKFEHLQPGGEG